MSNNVPKLIPVPVKTKNLPWYLATWNWLTKSTRWILSEDFFYTLEDGVEIVIPKGFLFDGASIPRAFWPLLSPDGIMFIQGLLHDFGYRFDHFLTAGSRMKYMDGEGQSYWDGMFYREGNRINGMVPLNYTAWAALRAFGWIAWKKCRARSQKDTEAQLLVDDGEGAA
jgi:hypothetical protein